MVSMTMTAQAESSGPALLAMTGQIESSEVNIDVLREAEVDAATSGGSALVLEQAREWTRGLEWACEWTRELEQALGLEQAWEWTRGLEQVHEQTLGTGVGS